MNCLGMEGCEFFVSDAINLNFKNESFTHVILGGHLPWVLESERSKHLKEAVRVLKTDGFLLTSLYYFSTKPSKNFLDKFNNEFGTSLTANGGYNYWSSLFHIPELSLYYESNYKIIYPSNKRKKAYLSVFNIDHLPEWENKVNLFIQNGNYLSFFVKVFRKEKNNIYRQYPRGGIYTWKKIDLVEKEK